MGTVKNIRKLSGASNELIAVDCAIRDIQGRKIVDTYATKEEIPTELPANGGNASYATTAGNANKCNNHTLGCDVPENAVFTDTWPSAYIATISKSGNTLTITPNTGSAITFTNTTYSNATQSAAGLMSSADKTKLDGLNGSNYLAKAGGTMTGHLKWNDSSALPSATAAGLTGGLQYILGIKSFADGGDTVYETKSNFLSGLVRFNEAQSLTDAQKTQARNNIGAGTGNGTVTKVDNVSPSSGNVSLNAVRYTSQSLTDAQKTQARANIGVAQKYRHHCTFEWNSGSGSNQYIGSLSFFFDDTYPDSYYDEDYGSEGILNFIKNHCNMPDSKTSYLSVTGGGTVGVEVASPYRHSEVYIAQALINNHGSWYYNGLYYAKTNNFGNFNPSYALGAYPSFIPWNGVAVLYDNVEPLPL